MNNNQKIAFSFATLAGIAIGSWALAIKQELQIDKLTRENKTLKKNIETLIDAGARTPGFSEVLFDTAVKQFTIPDDISTL